MTKTKKRAKRLKTIRLSLSDTGAVCRAIRNAIHDKIHVWTNLREAERVLDYDIDGLEEAINTLAVSCEDASDAFTFSTKDILEGIEKALQDAGISIVATGKE